MMTIIAYLFPKLQNAKNVVRQMYKKSLFRRPFDKQYGKQSQTLFEAVTAAPWLYLLIILKKIQLEKASVIDL